MRTLEKPQNHQIEEQKALAEIMRVRESQSLPRTPERLLHFEELDGTKNTVVHHDINEPLTHDLESEEYATLEEIGMDEIVEYENIYEALREYEEMRDNEINRDDDLDKDWDEMDY